MPLDRRFPGRSSAIVVLCALLAGCGGPGATPGPTIGVVPTPGPSSGPDATPSPLRSAAPRSIAPSPAAANRVYELTEFPVPPRSHPHDVAPATDGGIWYTGQRRGTLGHLDPATGDVREIALGPGSAPHGVIVGPDGAPWITDGGLNAIVRVDPATDAVEVFELPGSHPDANLNTAAFDGDGVLWFTGQAGMYGRLDPAEGTVEAFDAPRGRGPYGIAATPGGEVWYASLAGSHIARIDRTSREATIVEPPTANQGSRRIWSDSAGRLWIAEWNAGQVGVHDPVTGSWEEWPLPGDGAQAYAVYVDELDGVWLTDFGANAIVRFDPPTETFTTIELPSGDAAVRQLLGRPGEVWGAESALDRLVVIRAR
jgi:virginiamycin B lyase